MYIVFTHIIFTQMCAFNSKSDLNCKSIITLHTNCILLTCHRSQLYVFSNTNLQLLDILEKMEIAYKYWVEGGMFVGKKCVNVICNLH